MPNLLQPLLSCPPTTLRRLEPPLCGRKADGACEQVPHIHLLQAPHRERVCAPAKAAAAAAAVTARHGLLCKSDAIYGTVHKHGEQEIEGSFEYQQV